MNKRIFSAIAGLLVWAGFTPLAAQAQLTQAPIFAGIPWGTSESDTRDLLAKAGFVYDDAETKKETEHTLDFKGKVQGMTAYVLEDFDPQNRLVQTDVQIITEDNQAKTVADSLVQNFVKKYGASSSNKTFDYGNDEATFEKKIRDGSGQWYTDWDGPENHDYSLEVQVSPHLNVIVFYQSEAWAAEARRRKLSVPDKNL